MVSYSALPGERQDERKKRDEYAVVGNRNQPVTTSAWSERQAAIILIARSAALVEPQAAVAPGFARRDGLFANPAIVCGFDSPPPTTGNHNEKPVSGVNRANYYLSCAGG